MTTETMNTALVVAGLCWTKGPEGAVLVRSSHMYADPNARNTSALHHYVDTAARKGKTEAEISAALLAKVDGDNAPWAALAAGPDV